MPIQFKRTTNANSSSAVADGQPAVLKRDGKSPRLKIGDGTKTFTQLPFVTPDAEIYKDNSFTLSQGSTYTISTPQLLGIFIDNSLMLNGGNITVTSDFGRLQILDDIEGSTSASVGTSSFPYGNMYSKTYNLGVIGNISASIGQYGVLKSTLYENNTSFTNYYDIIQSSQTGLSFGGIGLPTSYGKIVFNYNPGGSSSDGIAITSSASLYSFYFGSQGIYPSASNGDAPYLGNTSNAWRGLYLGEYNVDGTSKITGQMKIEYNNDTQAIEFISL